MASYFDPKYWSPMRAAGVGKSWLDGWLSTTAAWVDPVATLGAGTVTALLPDVLMSVLTDGISRQFIGHEMELSLHGSQVRAVLDVLQVKRRGATFETTIELTNVDWDGHPLRELRIISKGVRLVPGVPTRLETRQVDVFGSVAMTSVINWLNTQELDWVLDVHGPGRIGARHKQRNLTAVVDAAVEQDLVRIKVIGARWYGVPLPNTLLPNRAIPLGPLPYDARIVSAVARDDEIDFVLDLPSFTGSLDLAQIRAAIVAGTRLIVW